MPLARVTNMHAKPPRWGGEREAFADALLEWIARCGESRYNEIVSQREHALQCAALAVRDGADDAEVVAALLHDVGHFIVDASESDAPPEHDGRHEEIGARWLARCFPPAVTEPIRFHVPAKRYLCAVEPTYHAGLSPASQHSLELQGGPMDDTEVVRFDSLPDAAAAIALRRRDDEAKVAGLDVAPLAAYRDRLVGLLGT